MIDKDMEVLANASIEQIEEMALANQQKAEAGGTGDGTAVASAGESAADPSEKKQAVEDGAAAGAGEDGGSAADKGDAALSGDESAEAIAMKSGKGTIPYAVLKETREELARAKQALEQIRKGSVDTAAAATLPENHATQVAEVNTGIQELGQKFESGDIDWEEYNTQLKELNDRREALIREEIKVQVAKDMAQDMVTKAQEEAVNTWGKTVEGFLGTQHDGIDYRADKALYSELDTMVKALGNDPANNDKDHQWFLDTAHAVVMVKHGRIPAVKQQGGQQQQQSATAPFHTLSDLPGGEVPTRDGVEQVAQLSGEALTNRFLNDPSQIDKVLNSLAM